MEGLLIGAVSVPVTVVIWIFGLDVPHHTCAAFGVEHILLLATRGGRGRHVKILHLWRWSFGRTHAATNGLAQIGLAFCTLQSTLGRVVTIPHRTHRQAG